MNAAVWFRKMALTEGEHPVVLAKNKVELEKAKIDPAILTPEFIYRMVIETAELAFARESTDTREMECKSQFHTEYWQSIMRSYESYYKPHDVITLIRQDLQKRDAARKKDFIEQWLGLIPHGMRRFKCQFCGFDNVNTQANLDSMKSIPGWQWSCLICRRPIGEPGPKLEAIPPGKSTAYAPVKPKGMIPNGTVNSRYPGLGGSTTPPPAPVETLKLPSGRKLERTVKGIPVYSEPGKEGKRKFFVFGYRTSELLRWCGQDAMTSDDVKKLLHALGIKVTDDTIKAQMSSGRTGNGHFGPPAPVTEKESELIYALLDTEGEPCPVQNPAKSNSRPQKQPNSTVKTQKGPKKRSVEKNTGKNDKGMKPNGQKKSHPARRAGKPQKLSKSSRKS